MMKKNETHTVVAQEWEESERGWGCRPDGFSLHLTIESCKAYIAKEYSLRQKEVPDVYTRVCGEPRPITVNEETFEKLHKSPNKVIWVDKLPKEKT